MTTLELAEAKLSEPEQFGHIQVHDIGIEALRLLIEGCNDKPLDPGSADIIVQALNGKIFATSRSGSMYEIDFEGTTKEKIAHTGLIKVRWAKCISTKTDGRQEERVIYIGLSSSASMQFFNSLDDEKPIDDEHTFVRDSSGILESVQLVIDWSNE